MIMPNSLAVLTLESPETHVAKAIAAAQETLAAPGLPAVEYERALVLLAAVVYARSSRLSEACALGVLSIFRRPDLPDSTLRLAGEVLSFLLTTRVGAPVAEGVAALLSQPGEPSRTYEILLGVLNHAAFWATDLFDFEALLSLAELGHLTGHRKVITQTILEPWLYAAGGSVTSPALDRLLRLAGANGSSKYWLYYVNARTDFQEDVRALAGASLPGRLSLHRVVATRLGAANARVLVLQNIKDGQGDEIVRCVPLLQSLLDYNRELEIVLVTQRAYMYAHPRVTIIPPGEHDRFDAVLQQSFDAVVGFFE